MNIGELRAEAIYDGVMRAPAPVFFGGTTTEQWAPHQRFLEPDGNIRFDLGGFLVRAGERVVLVDAGIGPRSGLIRDGAGSFQGGELLNSLAKHGVRPEDVTDVVFTHLHFDHVGWSTRDGQIVFPNATFRCDERDWEHFRGNERVWPTVEPLEQGRLEMWSGSGSLFPGVDLMAAPGHTPGSTVIVLSSGTARGMLLGDVVHCPVEFVDEDWAGVGDLDPELAKRTRNALALELDGTDIPVAPAHFPGLVFGRLLKAEGRRQWVVA